MGPPKTKMTKIRIEVEDEILMVEDGGEMPEVALYSSLYYLRQDQEGPQLTLTKPEIGLLKKAVLNNFNKIIQREIRVENRGTAPHRGLERTIANWFRLQKFAEKEQLNTSKIKKELQHNIVSFICHEYNEVLINKQQSVINCSPERLLQLCQDIDLDLTSHQPNWQQLF